MSEYGKLFTKIKVHPTLWFVIGISVATAHFTEMMMLLAIIFVHEMGHAVCAQYFKWRIKSIGLLPFGGNLETEEYGNKSLKEDMLVVLAGPIQHIWLIGLSYGLYFFSVISYDTYQTFFYMNMILFLFNLLPIWPLDGGRLLFIGIARYHSFLEAQTYTLVYISSYRCCYLFDVDHNRTSKSKCVDDCFIYMHFDHIGVAATLLCFYALFTAAALWK